MLQPVVVNVGDSSNLPHSFHLPPFFQKWFKLITGIAAVVISASMIFIVVTTFVANDDDFKKSHNIGTENSETPKELTGTEKSDAALPGGGIATGVGGTTGTNSPVVTLTAEPASVSVGAKSKLKWSVTNSPQSCVASEDWSGEKSVEGSEDTPALSIVQTYLFTLTCKTATGTGFATVSVGVIQQGGSGNTQERPSVTLSAIPSSIYVGDSSTLTWDVTNDATSCTASGDWSSAKSTAGPESTGALTTEKTYTYTLTCKNGAGEGYATTTVKVVAPPPDIPLVLLSSNPVSPITPGTSVTLSWTVTNSPTSCVASGDWSGNKSTSGSSYNLGALNTIKTYSFIITCTNASGSSNDTAAILVLPNAPSVSLTLSPNSIYTGSSSTITWSATNSPTSCTASGDWSGAKASSGTQSTGTLSSVRTYYYSISCVNAGGTGYANNISLTVANPPAPAVTFDASPIAITSGSNANLTWSATNSPTSCTASGDWSGAKASSGTQSTGTLSSVRTYSYTLSCSNAGGSNSATTSVSVSSGGSGVVAPVVTIAVAPTSIGSGNSSTISWSATNSPTSCTASNSWSGAKSSSGSASTGTMNTAGSYTYTLSCSNSAGSDSKSTSLTVIAIPVVTISVNPSSINSGSSSTITWSVTNTPSSCTAGGSWSGSKASSGSQSTGAIGTAGTYSYSLSCTNSGGTASASATLVVSNAAPVYCGGLTTCYGVSELASHAVAGNCWAWNTGTSTWPWAINITSFRPNHPGGAKSGTLEEATAVCNHNINNILKGTASIPSFKDKNNSTTFNHSSGTKNNSGSSGISSYRLGYYDASKP